MKRLSRVIALSISLLFLLAFSSAVISAYSPVVAKDRAGDVLITSSDLDHAFVQSATVKYQLTDEEIQGLPLTYSNGTIVRRFNATIIVDYTAIDARRDELGRRLFRVKVDRPDYLGGVFEKDAPFDNSRSPGTIDTIQPGDLKS